MGSVVDIRPVGPEPYVDAAELARLLGISKRTVARWVEQGAPSETWGLRARRFRVSQVRAWAANRRAA